MLSVGNNINSPWERPAGPSGRGDTIFSFTRGPCCVSVWVCGELPYGRRARPLRTSVAALRFHSSQAKTQPGPPPPPQIAEGGVWKWRAFHKGELEKFKFRGIADKRDRLRKTHRRKRTIQMERNDKRGRGGEARDTNREKEEWWWEKERVKGRKWGERKWRGQVQQRSRWEEGKSDGVVRSERVEKLMSLLLFDGACLLQRQDAFLTFSFRDPVFFPVFPLYFFSTLSIPLFVCISCFFSLSDWV